MAIIYLPPNPNNIGGGLGAGLGQALGQQMVDAFQRKRFVNALQQAQGQPSADGSVGPTPANTELEQVLTLVRGGMNPNEASAMVSMQQQGALNRARTANLETNTEKTKAMMPFEQRLIQARSALAEGELPLQKKRSKLMDLQGAAAEEELKLAPLKRMQAALEVQAAQELNPMRKKLLGAQINQLNTEVEVKQHQLSMAEQLAKQLQQATNGGDQTSGTTDDQVSPQPSPGSFQPQGSGLPFKKTAGGQEDPSDIADDPNLTTVQKAEALAARLTTARQGRNILSTMSPEGKLATQMDLAAGNLPAAAGRISEEGKPTGTETLQLGPGLEMKAQVFRDGSVVPIKGTYKDSRKAPTEVQIESAEGVSQLSAVVDAMDQIIEGTKGSQIVNDRIRSSVNKFLTEHHLPSIGKAKNADEALNILASHALIGINKALKGSRQTDTLRKQMQEILPSPLDPPELTAKKKQAMRLMLDMQTKNEVESMRENGQKVPGAYLELYKKNGLGSKTYEDMQNQFVQLTAGLAQGADKSGMRDGYKIEDLEYTAKQHGMTVDQVLEQLKKNAAGSPQQ